MRLFGALFCGEYEMPKKKNVVEENIDNLKKIVDSFVQDPSIDRDMKATLVIHVTSLVCAIVAVQPIPFADIFVLSPIQLVMVTALNSILGNPFEKSSLKELLTSLLGVIGWGTLAQHVILGLYKTVLPFLGGFTTIPLVYGATFALGTGARIMISARKDDQTVSDAELKAAMEKARKEATESHKKMSISEAMDQISKMASNADEYDSYKKELKRINEQLTKALGRSHEDTPEVGELLNKNFQAINRRMKKYNNVIASEYVICLFAMISDKDFIEVAEPIIGDINYRLNTMNLTLSSSFDGGRFYEVQTTLGVLFLKEVQKIEIVSLDYAEPYSDNPILQYISPPNIRAQILRDIQIRDKFYSLIKESESSIDIISPWVGYRPFDKVSGLLSEAASRGVKIRILYGIGDSGQKKNKKEEYRANQSEEYIGKYKEKLGTALRAKKTNTHAKLVICDGKCYLSGSMNVLSFEGNWENEPDLHHEMATMSYDQKGTNDLLKAYFNW